MKITILIQLMVAAVLLTGQTTVAQMWIQQTPCPADDDLRAVFFTSPDRGWISGVDDILMETSDGGTSWTQSAAVERTPLFLEDPIDDIQFVDPMHGWAWGNNGYRTSDGGVTWQSLPVIDSMEDIQFLNQQTGYLRANQDLYRTDDGGQSTFNIFGDDNNLIILDVSFASVDEGLMLAFDFDFFNPESFVYRTLDGGKSWQLLSNLAFQKVQHVAEDVYVAGFNGQFFRSVDAGQTWNLMHVDMLPGNFTNNSIEGFCQIDGDSLAAIDINARIWISHDTGLTWTRTQDVMGNWGFGWDIQFPAPDTGYAVGRLGIIYKSTDAGANWTQINNGAAQPMADIEMHPTGVGIAAGNNGTVVRTSDFGRNWTVTQLLASEVGPHLNTVEMIDGNTFLVAGEQGALFRTDDGGATWVLQAELPYNEIFDLAFLSENEGWSCGQSVAQFGFIATTTDGGATWTRIDNVDITPPTGIQVMSSGAGWAIVPGSNHLATEDHFDNYQILAFPALNDSMQWFEFATEEVGWYGGVFGTLLKTTTGGNGFVQQELPGFVVSGGATGHSLLGVKAISTDEAYISTSRPGMTDTGVIYHTLDGGQNWIQLDPIDVPTNTFGGAVGPLSILASGEIWATGGNGFIFVSDLPQRILPGDVNVDGVVNLLDVASFVDLLTSGQFQAEADINGDGAVDLLDVTPFVNLLTE